MEVTPEPAATLADLMRVKGRAELVGGRVVHFPLRGFWWGRIEMRVVRSLEDGAAGEAFMGSLAYGIEPPLPSGRQSFSPAASLYTGPPPANPMSYIPGPPTFAVELRDESDHGPAKERELADKRGDYFAAGTLAVWDVDLKTETVTLYLATAPTTAVIFRRGDTAHAEPAVPGWRLSVDALFA